MEKGKPSRPKKHKRKHSDQAPHERRWCWVSTFLTIASIQAVAAIVLESYCLIIFEQNLTVASFDPAYVAPGQTSLGAESDLQIYTSTIPTFLALFISGMVYELVLIIDALRTKNIFQVVCLCFCNMGFMIYSTVEVGQLKFALKELQFSLKEPDLWGNLRPPIYAVSVTLALGTILMSFVAWKLHNEFAWTMYKKAGADLKLRRKYLNYQIYTSFLKFDVFLLLGYMVQFLVVVRGLSLGTDVEFWSIVGTIPLVILVLALAALWAKRENMGGMAFTILFYIVTLAYLIFNLIRIWSSDSTILYQAAAAPLTISAIAAMIVLVGTVFTAGQCTRDFGYLTIRNADRKQANIEADMFSKDVTLDASDPAFWKWDIN